MNIKKIPVSCLEVHAGHTDTWAGNCHGIAEAMRQLLNDLGHENWVVARGHWVGPIEDGCAFGHSHRPFTAHSWCQNQVTGEVLDPTCYAFYKDAEPGIRYFERLPQTYDLFGCHTRRSMAEAAVGNPPFSDEHRGKPLDFELPKELEEYMRSTLKHEPPFGIWEWYHVANGGPVYNPTPEYIGICEIMIREGREEGIPLDIRRWFGWDTP